jgi:GLPGLI family protein
MDKKIIQVPIMSIWIISFLLPNLLFAQEGTLNYSLEKKNPWGISTNNYIIYFNNKGSIQFFLPKNNLSLSEKISDNEYKEIKTIESKLKPFVYKDVNKKKVFLGDNIELKYFLISDSLNNFNWKITSTHKTILNYNCTKATLNFRGRSYEAWFTDQIPLRLGPWKFGDLPGLIIKISDVEGKFIYELTGIDLRVNFDKNLINIPANYKGKDIIGQKEFISIYNKKVENYEKMGKVINTYENNATGNSKTTLAEKQEKF